jgi:DNA processing protein
MWDNVIGVKFNDISKTFNDSKYKLFNSTNEFYIKIYKYFKSLNCDFSALFRNNPLFPSRLFHLPLSLLYYKGDISILPRPCVSIIGSRKTSRRGLEAAERIAAALSQQGYVIVSGLAAGVDAAAHGAAMAVGGKTIGVIGTPINQFYPPENKNLQLEIAKNHLLLSHVPFYKYSQNDYRTNSGYFPERNKIMAALSEATIIVEASDTSGALTQARECVKLNKKLIILKHLVTNKNLKWPNKYINLGALIADSPNKIKELLK